MEEMDRILPVRNPAEESCPVDAMDLDVADLKAALIERKTTSKEIESLLMNYRSIRNGAVLVPGYESVDDFLSALPREFAQYAKGASAYHHHRYSDALTAWQTLLELPENERRYRSTWATYMCGRTYLRLAEQAEINLDAGPVMPAAEFVLSAQQFKATRALAGNGYQDSLELATDSIGWLARIAYLRHQYMDALLGYAEQYSASSRTGRPSALLSMRLTCSRMIWKSKDRLVEYAKDPLVSKFLSAYVLCRKGNGHLRRKWMETIVEAKTNREHPYSDRFAWLAYQAGDIQLARSLLAECDQQEPIVMWLNAKFALWDGNEEQAIEILEKLGSRFPSGTTWSVNTPEPDGSYTPMIMNIQAELGLLHLGRQQFERSLNCFLKAGLWLDAAYVAEKVMNVKELELFVRRRKTDSPEPCDIWCWAHPTINAQIRLEHLLARRLMREGNRALAAAYFPEPHQRWAKMLNHHQDLFDHATPSLDERANHLYQIACLTRYHGMELLGTELDPDWYAWGGSYDAGKAGTDRLDPSGATEQGPFTYPVSASESERIRVRLSEASPYRRFHYRFLAADIMWRVAALLPDNDERTALALYQGGTFLKKSYPDEADRFYKALVNRCSLLPIGKSADELRWFPSEFVSSSFSSEMSK